VADHSSYFITTYKRDKLTWGLKLLQIKDLRIGQWKKPCIGFTQENSIENSV